MRFSTRIHGVFDYLLGLLLIVSPWVLGMPMASAGEWAPTAVGIALILNALVTDFELGLLRKLHIPVHLWIDGVLAVVLAISPWIFGFDRHAWIPHLVVGVAIAGIAFLTHTVPGYERRRSEVASHG